MRSLKKLTTGVAFLALSALLLAGCATPVASPGSVDLCESNTTLEQTNDELKEAKAELENVKGLVGETEAQEEVDRLETQKIALQNCGDDAEENTDETPSPKPTATPTADTCLDQFVQVEVRHEGNKVDSDFEAKYEAAVADAANLSDAQRELLISEAGHNAGTLARWSMAFGLLEDPNNYDSLVEDGCLSAEGQKLHAMLAGILSAKGTTFEEADAPASGVNTGVHDGQFGIAEDAGITGNLRAIKTTLNAGTKHETVVWILVRCANPVFPPSYKPKLPVVPTDQPKPPKPTTPPEPPAPKNIEEAPQRQGNLPQQQMPNPLPADPKYYQPNEPNNPPSVYVPPAPPAPAPPAPAPPSSGNPNPAPVPTKDPAPAPAPRPSAPPPEAPISECDPSAPMADCG